MRFRTGLVVGGVLGYLIGRQMSTREGGDDRPSGVRAAMARHPSAARFGALAERAGSKGVEALQRARASIQRRLIADVDDLSMN